MVLILIFVIALVAWALHLMQQAIDSKEFSLMLAGFLVASAAAAMMAVYFLMGDYMGYVTRIPQRSYSYNVDSVSIPAIAVPVASLVPSEQSLRLETGIGSNLSSPSMGRSSAAYNY